MSRTVAHPSARLAAAGFRVPAPPPVSRAALSNEGEDSVSKQGVRPELVDILPQFEHRTVYASEIVLPANTTFGLSTEKVSAVYCLGRYKPQGQVGEEFALSGIGVELLPSDSTGALAVNTAGIASSTAFGATDGTAAAIIVMQSSGLDAKTWGPMAVFAPALETYDFCLDSSQRPAEYIEVLGFPTGKLNDTTPNKLYLPISYLPTQRPIVGSDSIDVLLAVRRSQVATNVAGTFTSGAAAKALRLHAKITLRLMKTIRSAFYRR